MIKLLDDTLTKLLETATAGGVLNELHNAAISFVTPEEGYALTLTATNTVNRFCMR